MSDQYTKDALSFIGESLSKSDTVNPVFAKSVQQALTDKEREDIIADKRVEHASIYA